MAYQVLARKYRPLSFSDVVGQDHVTRTLLNALAQNRIAHGYIFSGHRGIGKTTIARIVASALNCRTEIGTEKRPTPEPCNACDSCLEIRDGSAVDVIEIDAATNRGIDEVRELRDAARYRPARDKYKIIILDEAHQITDAAFNALLKTLEEPPDHIVFMFATTEPENIPQTIRSRCQHFSFHAVKLDDIVGQLRKISDQEALDVDDATLALLAEAGDGSMRDALSIMDQAIASAPLVDGKPHLELEQVRELMGSVSNVIYEQVLEAVQRNNSADVLAIVARLLDSGNGPQQIARQFVRYLRNCVVAKITALSPDATATGIAADLLQISPEERSRAARSAALFTEEDLARFLSIMLRTFDDLGFRQEQRFHLELGLLKLVHAQRLLPIEDLLSQLGTPTPVRPITTSTAASQAPPTSTSPRPGAPGPASGPRASTTASTPATPSAIMSSRPEATPFAATQPFAPKPAVNTAQPVTAGALAIAPDPIPAPKPRLVPDEPADNSKLETQNSELKAEPQASAAAPGNLDAIQSALVAALADAKGQETASHQIEEATFTQAADGTIQIQTTVSKAMLPALFNAEANKLLTAALRSALPGTKFTLLPGTPASSAPKKSSRPARAGSAAELAEKHPIVQQAKTLFSAEISNIIDLRDKE